MCRFLGIVAAAVVLSLQAGAAQGQAFVGGPYTTGPYRVSDYFAAPGLYGTSYGFASYGVPRTFTTFSAYPGPSYGSNYPSYGLLPGRYGVGLWRPGFVAPGYVYGAPTSSTSYRTFPVVYGTGLNASQIAPPPSIGVYAPGSVQASVFTAGDLAIFQTGAAPSDRLPAWNSQDRGGA